MIISVIFTARRSAGSRAASSLAIAMLVNMGRSCFRMISLDQARSFRLFR
jgi:hypothetical protein